MIGPFGRQGKNELDLYQSVVIKYKVFDSADSESVKMLKIGPPRGGLGSELPYFEL